MTEDPGLPMADPHNPANPWQGGFRVGHFDAVAHRYALAAAGGVDGLALTHLDPPPESRLQMCLDSTAPTGHPGLTGDLDRQERLTRAVLASRPRLVPVPDWTAAVSEQLATPVVLESWGPRSEDKTSTDSAAVGTAQLTC